MNTNKWYAYLHINGLVLIKRYFSPDDILEAKASDFSNRVIGPFDAINQSDAQIKANEALLDL